MYAGMNSSVLMPQSSSGMVPAYANRPRHQVQSLPASSTAYPDDYKILFAHDCVPSTLPAAVRQLIVRIFEVAVIDDVDKRMRTRAPATAMVIQSSFHAHFAAAVGNSDQDITYNIIDETRKECIREKFNTNPDPIDVFYKHLKCKIEPLDVEHDEYKMVQQYFSDAYAPAEQQANRFYPSYSQYSHAHSQPLLQYVFRVTRDGEDKRFSQSPYGASKDRQLLWHGSGMTNFGGILSQGLRVAPRGAQISGAAHGSGIYFSDSIAYSSGYTRYNQTRDIGMFLVCEVADVKRATKQQRNLTERPDICDALKIVAIPTGVNDGGAIYVAPEPAQVRMRYLVQVGYGKRQPPAAAASNHPLLMHAFPVGSMQNGSNFHTAPSSSNDTGRGSHPILLKRSELVQMGLARKTVGPKKLPAAKKSKLPPTTQAEKPFEVKRGLVEDEDIQMLAVVTKKSAADSLPSSKPTVITQQQRSVVADSDAVAAAAMTDGEEVDDAGLFDLADDDDDYGFDVGEPSSADDDDDE